jgi:hypothetical protein
MGSGPDLFCVTTVSSSVSRNRSVSRRDPPPPPSSAESRVLDDFVYPGQVLGYFEVGTQGRIIPLTDY